MADFEVYVNNTASGNGDGQSAVNAYETMRIAFVAESLKLAGGSPTLIIGANDRLVFNCAGLEDEELNDLIVNMEQLGLTRSIILGKLRFVGNLTQWTQVDPTKHSWKMGNTDKPFRIGNCPDLEFHRFNYNVPRGGATYPFHVRSTISGPGAPSIKITESILQTNPTYSSNKDVYRIDGTSDATDLDFIVEDSSILGRVHSLVYFNYIAGTNTEFRRSTMETGRFVVRNDGTGTYTIVDSAIDKTGEDAYANGTGTFSYCATNDGFGTSGVTIPNWAIEFINRAGLDVTLSQSSSMFGVGSTSNNIGSDQLTTSTNPSNFTSINGGATIAQTARDVPIVFDSYANPINAISINEIDHSDLLENITAVGATLKYIRRLTNTLGTETFSVVLGDGTIQKARNNDFTTSFNYPVTYGFVDDNGIFAGVTVTNDDAVFREVTAPTKGVMDYTANLADNINEIYTPQFGDTGVYTMVMEVYDPGTNDTNQGTVTLNVSGDATAPNFLVPVATSSINDNGFTVTYTSDDSGTSRSVVVLNGSAAPSAAEVFNGTGSGGAAPAFASPVMPTDASTGLVIAVTGLSPGERYDTYVVIADPSANSNLGSALDTLTTGQGQVTNPPVFIGNISNQSNPDGTAINLNIASQWSNDPQFFAVTTEQLPSNLSLDNSGLVSGTLDTVETRTGVIITATNSAGDAVSNAFNWEVTAVLQPAAFIGNLVNRVNDLGQIIDIDISDQWSNNPTSFTVTSGALPIDLSLSNTGRIQGTLNSVMDLQGIIISAGNASNTGSGVPSNAFSWTVSAPTSTKVANISGVVESDGTATTRTYSNWYLTASNIEDSNKAGVAIVPVASGENLVITNGAGQVSAPGASVGVTYTMVASVDGSAINGQTDYFRDVTINITEV